MSILPSEFNKLARVAVLGLGLGGLGPSLEFDSKSNFGFVPVPTYDTAWARGDGGADGGDAGGCGCDGGDNGGTDNGGGNDNNHQEHDVCYINPGNAYALENGLVSLQLNYLRTHEGRLTQIEDVWTRPERITITREGYDQLLRDHLRTVGGLAVSLGLAEGQQVIALRGAEIEHAGLNGRSDRIEIGGESWMQGCRSPKRTIDGLIQSVPRPLTVRPQG